MDRIARASTGERRLVFEAAAQRMALAPAVVEKDFWVCYTLDHLFHRSGFAESMVFKGGTSLSKAFGLIERFSEDIDLILDWRLLGYGEDEPWEPHSNSAQERFKADSIERTNAFLADAFAPKLRATLSESLGTEASVYTVRDIDGVPAIVKGYGNAMDFFAEFVRDWEQMRAKLDDHEITQEEYEDWKRTWDNGAWLKTGNGKSLYTGK